MRALLTPLKKRAMSDDVSDHVKDAIFAGRLKPGDPLRELHLARALSVSQATVRDALVKLERFGLVVRVPNKETIVTRHSRGEIRERIELRAVLEERAFVAAASRLTAEDYVRLAEKVDRITKAFRRRQYFEAAHLDLDFHRYVWERSGNRLLFDRLEQLTMPLFAFISVLRSTGTKMLPDAVAPHQDLLAALQSKKAARIARALREHVVGSYEGFLNSGADSLEMMLKHQDHDRPGAD